MVTITLGVTLGSHPARAETAAEAFARGREALRTGNYREACEAFEDSQRAEPSPETQFNIALCSEQLGKLATALRLHRQISQRDDTPRKAKAAELAAELEPRVARLRIKVKPSKVQDLVVTVGGEPVVSLKDVPIDLGTTRVVASAPGYAEWTGDVTITGEAKTERVVIRLVRDDGAPDEPDEPDEPDDPPGAGAGGADPATPRDRPSSRRAIAGVTIVVGGVALVGAGALGVLAAGKWSDAKLLCPDTRCPTQVAYDQATQLRTDARLRGNLATALFITGGLAVAGGIVLWVNTPAQSRSLAIAPSAGPGSASLTVVGRF